MAKKPEPFNNPFRKLSLDAAKPAPKQPPPRAPGPPPAPRERSEEELWQEAIAGARRVERDHRGHVSGKPPPPAAVVDPELEAHDELRAFVEGETPFDIADSDEFIEGAVEGLDTAVLRRLRRGDYAVQGHVDLHGLSRPEAKQKVEAYLREARLKGHRCVLVVHGRGLHSKDQVPVLKDALRKWLSAARFARHVLAFATARPQDGGAGAVYVLLRRAGR